MKYAVFLPNLVSLRGNPYWDLLASSLKTHDITVVENNPNSISLRWLLRNRGTISVLHYHYIQDEYAYEYTHARLRWVLRFFRNLIVARLLGYRIVWTMHNLQPSHPLKPAWVEQLAHWVIATLSHSVIVHCESARELLAKTYGRRRNVIIAYHPHFIDIYPATITRELARSRLGLNKAHRVLLYFGGIRPNKGIEDLISSFKTIIDPNLRLIIAGAPQVDPGYVDRLVSLSTGDDRIIFKAERIPDQEVPVLFGAADLVTLPFARVLTSSSLALAMSFARPVVVPDLGCMANIVTPDVGWVYEPGNMAELTLIIQQAFSHDLDVMGDLALQRIATYTWDDFAIKTLSAYGIG